MLCSRCQHTNPADARFCTECGQALPRCRNCGTSVTTSYKFCPNCGVPLVMAATAGGEIDLPGEAGISDFGCGNGPS